MASFFKSPEDLVVWLKKNCSSAPEASAKMITLAGSKDSEQDVVESVRRIFEGEDVLGASSVLFNILSKYEITQPKVNAVNEGMHKVIAADALLKANAITADAHAAMIKEAQVMRQPGEYQALPLRVCPKLPKQSAGQQLISTYNCRHYCLDSLVFDDDPMRVYCAETIWRKHIMDKFSREWKDENGELIGGYINNRFYKFPTAGTPSNPDVPRDQGNKMGLAPGERTRQPRPHEYSTERRLQEQRDPGSTESILLSQASSKGFVKLASVGGDSNTDDEKLVSVFSKIVDLHNSGLNQETVAVEMVKETGWSAEKIIKLQSIAMRKMKTHQADFYSIVMGKKVGKKAQIADVLLQVPSDKEIKVKTVNGESVLEPETILIEKGENSFEICNADTMQGTGVIVSFINPNDRILLSDFSGVIDGFKELGETNNPTQNEKTVS